MSDFTDPPPPYSPVRVQPVFPVPAITSDPAKLSIHHSPNYNGMVVRVQPPAAPNVPQPDHIPCDIVLVIDVSGSMNSEAKSKTNGEDGNLSSERFGFSILDLTKHAARTILSTLGEEDRLGVVTFGTSAKVIQGLLPMDHYNKKQTDLKIGALATGNATNLWHGIQEGIRLFDGQRDTGRVPAIMVLTDGMPNHKNPTKGFIPALRETYETLPATIHTFGFGYHLESGLLKSIAELAGGNYAFIPDANMIGTVFINAVAHLQSTFGTRCTLEVAASKGIRLQTIAGTTIDWRKRGEMDAGPLIIDLGNLQYGQSRDIFLELCKQPDETAATSAGEGSLNTVIAELVYSQMTAEQHHIHIEENTLGLSYLSESEFAYHKSRSMLCSFFSSLFPLAGTEEYRTAKANPERHQEAFRNLLESIPARTYADKQNKSLMLDLDGEVRLALSRADYFATWGCHYFFSLWNAHAKQLRNSFKDHGPLMYNENACFIKRRDVLDNAFNNLPAPSQHHARVATRSSYNISMRSLNVEDNPCFSGSSRVALASGRQVPVRKLRRGVSVRTPTGSRLVSAVLKTMVHGAAMCKVGDLVVTPWHPVKVNDTATGSATGWVFPADLEQPQVVLYSGPIYSVLLHPSRNVESHALHFGGVWAVTLGHGLVQGDDVRAHRFLGDYVEVKRAIMRLRPRKDGVALSGGVKRRGGDGLVSGFKKSTL